MSNFLLRAVAAYFLCGICVLPAGAAATAVKRPMNIHKVSEIGLEIWTEAGPEWEVRTDYKRGQATFVAETPALAVPPAGMSWVSIEGISFTDAEIREGARGAIEAAAQNYGSGSKSLELRAVTYGELAGYEADFSANAHGTPVDVRVFCGHRPGKPAVLMHAFTLHGKLSHISEHVRRSWTHVRYLE
jgi:hypothetical protein